MTGPLHRIGWIAVAALAIGVVCSLIGVIALPHTAMTYSTSPVERGSVVTHWIGPVRGYRWLVAGGLAGAACAVVILGALVVNHRAAMRVLAESTREARPSPSTPSSPAVASVIGWLAIATLILALVALGVGLAALDRHHVLAADVANPDGSPSIPGHLFLDAATAFFSAGWIAIVVRSGIAMSAGAARSQGSAPPRTAAASGGAATEPPQLT